MDFLGADICPILEPSLASENGIEAFDVSSLLEQFEEASQSSEESCHVGLPSADLSRNEKLLEKTVKPSNNVTPEKRHGIKFGVKRKGAILLPLGVPFGRGRGKAQAISPCHSSSKLQKILLKNNTETNNNIPVPLKNNPIPALNNNVSVLNNNVVIQSCGNSGTVSPVDSSPKEQIPEELSSTYYSEIIDHDYCQNFPASLSPPSREPLCLELSEIPLEVLQLHDPASLQFDQTTAEHPKKSQTPQFTSIKKKITAKEYKHRYRNYRKKDDSIKPLTVNGKFFDKIPSYFTTLSLPSKPPKKDPKNVPRGGIKVADCIQRDISPSLNNSSDVYNKLPAYHNCFINSTKYDDSPAASSVSEIESLSLKNTKYPWDRLRDRISKDNSRSNSPLMMSSTRCESKSREMSCSPRRSRSPSRSPLPRRYRLSCSSGSSCSSSYSRSRSRSFERSRKRRRRRRERGHSYSSYSSRSSDSDWDSRSRSRSRSYSRSRSRGRTRSRSPICRSRRSSSYERRRAERDQLREEEKKRQIEERRIVYVGKIPETYTRRQLRNRFEKFGEIEETSVHFREAGDNYGFVTFSYTCDAYAAIEHGNKVAGDQRFDLCFGGRREFCAVDYADLDGQVEEEEESCFVSQKPALSDFDQLLKAAKRKLPK